MSYLPFCDKKITNTFLSNRFLPNNPKKLVPNYQTNSKNIFGRKKRNGPITSTFGPNKTVLILYRISKVWKLPGRVSSHSFFNYFLLIS